MTRKPFDCVEMKQYAAEHIYECIKEMTIEEELRFWNGAMTTDTPVTVSHENNKTQSFKMPVTRRSSKRRKKQPDHHLPVA